MENNLSKKAGIIDLYYYRAKLKIEIIIKSLAEDSDPFMIQEPKFTYQKDWMSWGIFMR